MREYSNTISLTKNIRGIYSLDTTLGCSSGVKENDKGCYGDCYAARYAKKYGYDFSKTKLRYFKDENHLKSIIRQINKADLSFIRIGTSGDPSEDWAHTLGIASKLSGIEKEIVIITKHWNNLTNDQLTKLNGVCINTSVSALDSPDLLENGLRQYERLKPFCKSVLRLVSCDFNLTNDEGVRLNKIQQGIFDNYNVLDTVFRVSKNNPLVTNGVINIKESKFLGKKCNISKFNKKTFFGKCDKCLEKCGVGDY